ncbi:hypothetical protein SB775_04645 [Peribacillus sp. SIMBA_075]|uniref:hypothetical protein n=1 Tax=Peribacillus sp. SIMBA_075 TaxID=3085813 RepID=UPI00397CF2D0
MKKHVIKQRGTALKERKLTSKTTESFTIEYTLQEALDIFLRAKVAEGVRMLLELLLSTSSVELSSTDEPSLNSIVVGPSELTFDSSDKAFCFTSLF